MERQIYILVGDRLWLNRDRLVADSGDRLVAANGDRLWLTTGTG